MENKLQPFVLGEASSLETVNQPSEMLKDLVLRWFLETQAPLVLQNGSLPEWFHGFITRKQTEDLLKDRAFGCFLIRLSERAFGYILSYRGKDRCRHFVISCQRNGHYVISGDTHTHDSLAELISYYQITEIEPFGENLTVACSKLEEKSIYDEISMNQLPSCKQSPPSATALLTRQASGSSPTTKPAKDDATNPSANSWRKLQEQQKSLSKESWNLSSEDTDAVPPIPDRSSLLMAKSMEEDVGNEGTMFYAALKKPPLDNRGLEMPKDMERAFMENAQKEDEPGRVNSSSSRKKMSSIFAMTKQSERLYNKKINLLEICHPETIYSEIGPDQDKCTLAHPEAQKSQSSLGPPKKATLSSPTSTPPKLSPKLPNKPKSPTEFQGSQSLCAVSSASLVDEDDQKKPSHLKTLSDPPKETMYGQINKMKSQKPTTCVCNNANSTYKQIPFGWSKSHENESEKLPKSWPTKPQDTYDEVGMKTGRISRTQISTENPYEQIPEHFLSTKHVPVAENTYEQISFSHLKGVEAKPSQKGDKPRKFLFGEKKTRF